MSPKDVLKVIVSAIDRAVNGEVPEWMNPIEKKAYALDFIEDKDIVICDLCGGTTWLAGYELDSRPCSCATAQGKAISMPAKRRIKCLFPKYEFINTPPCLDPKPDDTPERARKRAEIRLAIIEATERGDYEVLEHLTSHVWKDEI